MVIGAAYTIYKELEHLLRSKGIVMSPKRAGELTHNMYELVYTLSASKDEKSQLLKMDPKQRLLYDVVHK